MEQPLYPLTDYMRRGHPYDLYHSLFPGHSWEQMRKEWDGLSQNAAPEMVRILYTYIKTLPIPAPTQVVQVNLFPIDYAVITAGIVDKCVPQWNVVQRGVIWLAMYKELYKCAEVAWYRHCRKEDMPATPGQAVGEDILASIFKQNS